MAQSNQSTDLALADGMMEQSENEDQQEQKSGYFSSLGGVDVLRQITLIVALAICLAIAIFVIIWARQPDMRPLGKMQTEELIETLDFLDAQKIDYQLDGNVVSVDETEYQNIKLLMTREGLDQGPTSGSDIIMQDMGFGVSQRLERERLKHGREQQLARTIEELNNVTRAKVLLAIPKENVFARREKKPSATVVLTLKRGRSLDGEEVDSVVDMIASAVQGLEPSRVTVTDQNGRLLNSGSQTSLAARSRKEYDIERKREQEYLEKIDSILIPVVGLGNYTAQVDLSMDFSAVEETQKRYNPDLPAVRSETTFEENNIGGLAVGIPGALTNQPPVNSTIPEDAMAGGAGTATSPSRTHKEATRNYELDTTISHKRQQTGVIRRISVSVAVDYLPTVGENGETTMTPRSVEALSNIRRLLQGGVGFDMQRGDALEVVTVPFVREDSALDFELPLWEQDWFMKMMRLVLGALVIIVLILAVVKPMLKRLIYPDNTLEEYDEDSLSSGVDLGDSTLDMLNNDFDSASVGFSSDGTLRLPDLHGDEDLLKAVRALVANEPELSSQVVKAWLTEDD
ncbi:MULTISPECIES: flagellar basal-body MS-ring/collar protein FliF [Pseudoalteromonas]|uniref:Flagellar M-ring protein n=1 Tax=Pseudoalteromonas tetraodonis TaxID=43659 RepID=A0ABD4EU62_9GAMM|nr:MULTISPECIES: flagellar basal-body MS-ring/collar protein FliF [Pseudoalteromonas]KYL37113.1 flagellar M-ring protein FliF [Pseudoalteromonas spiralis]MDN3395801.1 flagellar basal-body MS-ring/collar protein FliF [Pseudoalteromonas sp. APC 3215]MDN3430479.1 flagellar basal-body MS-ring/collar protein FliF [Pseudoalteromonas sp. APC 3907]MDN3465274.1 flagellar basal-body MS-ring/collar protein FliF [Pseudoalteromonas sp. APC 3495]MDN3471798.1 flagellar basal-body MS-ring/collar protein FliF 